MLHIVLIDVVYFGLDFFEWVLAYAVILLLILLPCSFGFHINETASWEYKPCLLFDIECLKVLPYEHSILS
jgi:hypothetical protein